MPDVALRRVAGGWPAAATLFLCGAVAGLGQAPFDFVFATVAGLSAAFFLACRSAGRAARDGWIVGTGYFLVALHWIVEPFLVDAPRHGWMGPFALLLLAAGLGLFWAGAFKAASVVFTSPVKRIAGFAVFLAIAELLRAYVLTGFPWAMPAHGWVNTPALALSAAIGTHGLNLVTFMGAAVLATAAVNRSWVACLVGVSLFAAFLGIGAIMPSEPLARAGKPAIVRMVQPNAPQDEKWDPDRSREFVQRQVAYTARPAERPPDLVVWPETAVPYLIENAREFLESLSTVAGGATVVLGIQRRGLEPGWFHNSLAVLPPDGGVGEIYDKHHLVPFGEYMPLPWLMSRIGIQGIAERADGGYTPGPGPVVLDLGTAGRAVPLICYEAIFPQNILGAAGRPDFLLQITNDAWFGTFAGPYQHLVQARFRAAETGLPMVRVANTGISAVIDATGQVTAQIDLETAGYLDAELPPSHRPTLFSRTGDLGAAGLMTVSLALLLLAGRTKEVDPTRRHR